MTAPVHTPWERGPADFSIGLQRIPAERWFEGGEDLQSLRERKKALLETSPDRVWAAAEGSAAAQAEAAALIAQSLRRSVTGEPPLLAAAMQVPDDLCLMERRGGAWTLTALSLSAGTFFTASEVLGRALEDLHGPVPGFGERLLGRVSRIFDNLPCDAILERRNWTVLNSDALHLPDAAAVRGALSSAPAGAAVDLFVRVERQTLRALPATGARLFTIRVWTEPLSELARDRARLELFARAWRSATPDFRAYKGLALYDPLVEPILTAGGF